MLSNLEIWIKIISLIIIKKFILITLTITSKNVWRTLLIYYCGLHQEPFNSRNANNIHFKSADIKTRRTITIDPPTLIHLNQTTFFEYLSLTSYRTIPIYYIPFPSPTTTPHIGQYNLFAFKLLKHTLCVCMSWYSFFLSYASNQESCGGGGGGEAIFTRHHHHGSPSSFHSLNNSLGHTD